MAIIVIKDLEENRELDRKALAKVAGGYSYGDYYGSYINRYISIISKDPTYGTPLFGRSVWPGYRGMDISSLILSHGWSVL